MSSLPSINPRKMKHHDSVPVENLPSAPRKRHLDSIDSKESGSKNQRASSKSEKSAKKRDRKAEEKAMVKEQVAVAVKAVREVFESSKGQNILKLETRVYNAEQNGEYTKCKVKRKSDTDSLGISFTIPARVMALGWESGQHLVVTDTTKKPGVKSTLAVQDIVVAVDDEEVHSIEDLKRCVAGKKKMHFKCIRDTSEVPGDMISATQLRIEKALKAAVKAKVKASIKARRKHHDDGAQDL